MVANITAQEDEGLRRSADQARYMPDRMSRYVQDVKAAVTEIVVRLKFSDLQVI